MQYLLPALSLLTWLMSLAQHVDGHGHAIPRPLEASRVISLVALETDSPREYAAMLDVLASHESGYHTGVTGDSGRSCGAYQTPCGRTPPDGLGQTRLAARILKQAGEACPNHPLWVYASGACRSTAVALRYEAEVKRSLAVAE